MSKIIETIELNGLTAQRTDEGTKVNGLEVNEYFEKYIKKTFHLNKDNYGVPDSIIYSIEDAKFYDVKKDIYLCDMSIRLYLGDRISTPNELLLHPYFQIHRGFEEIVNEPENKNKIIVFSNGKKHYNIYRKWKN